MKSTITENEFQKQVIQLAKHRGWRVAHFRPGMNQRGRWMTAVSGDGVGFPDLVLTRGPEMMVVELKVGKNKLTPAQEEWLAAFREAKVAAFVWKPEDWDEIEKTLEHGVTEA